MQNAVKKYEETKATCTAWPLEEVTHVFYHILIKDTSKAFDGDYKEADYNQVMTTIDEFNKITQKTAISQKEKFFSHRGKHRLSFRRMMYVIIIIWMEMVLPQN